MTLKLRLFTILTTSVVLLNDPGVVQALAKMGETAQPAAYARASSHLQLVDARSYWHCHNLPRRTYCLKGGHLPRNWPPNSDTPGTAGLRKEHQHANSHAAHHRRDGWLFWR